jgi:hypothetical protein
LVKTPNVEASAGAGAIIEIPEDLEANLKPYIIQPSGQNLDGIMKCIQNKVPTVKCKALGKGGLFRKCRRANMVFVCKVAKCRI